jgi:hypothetical protein
MWFITGAGRGRPTAWERPPRRGPIGSGHRGLPGGRARGALIRPTLGVACRLHTRSACRQTVRKRAARARPEEAITAKQGRLTITVEGALAGHGRLALSELARFAGELQAEIERVARVLGGTDEVRTGRRPADVVEATRLDLVGFRRGSAVLDLEAHDQTPALLPSLLDESIDAFLDGVQTLAENPSVLPRGFDRSVVMGLKALTGSLGRAVTSIRINRPGREPILLDESVKEAARVYLREGLIEETAVTGRLHMGDFAPSALRCRIDTLHGSVTCDFDDELRDQVLAAMDQLVVGRGRAERLPDSGNVRLLHLDVIELMEDAGHRSVEELIAEQGVQPIEDARALAVGPDEDFDAYLSVIRGLRASA